MRIIKDIAGQRFGKLIAATPVELDSEKYVNWLCKCDCGNTTIVNSSRLIHGRTKSCGCLKREMTTARNKSAAKYNARGNRIYRIYYGILTRCFNQKDDHYPNYGGRGITVCQEWKESFEAFRDWSLANGYQKNLSIDRINNDGNYEPFNCRWATAKEQANNRRQRRINNE